MTKQSMFNCQQCDEISLP